MMEFLPAAVGNDWYGRRFEFFVGFDYRICERQRVKGTYKQAITRLLHDSSWP